MNIEKAVDWLRENAQNYYYSSSQADNCYFDDEELIVDFKKAMEGVNMNKLTKIQNAAKDYADFRYKGDSESRISFEKGAEWMLSQVEELYKNEQAMQFSFWSKFMNFKEMMKE